MTTEIATKERPILFSGPMIRAILDGRKTMTRRVVKSIISQIIDGIPYRLLVDDGSFETHGPAFEPIRCPYGAPGDRLWVRETFFYNWFDDEYCDEPHNLDELYYRADGIPDFEGEEREMRWTPSIHMPRWASRILLEVVSVRVERLQDITEADAVAEGLVLTREWIDPQHEAIIGARGHFQDLWNGINGKREGCSWDENPYVWVVEFKVIAQEVPVHG